ncbi:hypothetical protein [Streptomyces sp. cg2]|uniref:hypothetical protein n=1 Tax=Streptomyces sp. cg2 TaxID=3238799 RepID=UPI0034E2D146
MSDAREAARPRTTVMAAPARLVGGEAKSQTQCDAREAARPRTTVMAAPARLVGGAANGRTP